MPVQRSASTKARTRRDKQKRRKLFSCSVGRKDRARARWRKLSCLRKIDLPVRKRSRIGYEDRMSINKSLELASVAIISAAPGGGDAIAADQNNLVANTAIDGPVLTFDWPAMPGRHPSSAVGYRVLRRWPLRHTDRVHRGCRGQGVGGGAQSRAPGTERREDRLAVRPITRSRRLREM